MIKVAVCINGLEVGGAEMVLFDLLKRMPPDIAVHVYSLIDGGALKPQIEALGIPVTGLHMRRGVPSPGALLRLVREFRRETPDVVHTWLYHADLLGGLAARMAGIRSVVWHLHNNDLSPERVRFSTRAVALVCAWLSHWVPRRILACGDEVMRVHIARGYSARKMVVAPNGVDTERFQPSAEARDAVRAEFGVPRGVPLVGLIARFDPQKDHTTFFAAVRAFQLSGGDAFFLLAGREVDEDNPVLRRQRSTLPDPDRVLLLGERRDIPRIMAALDINTSSSVGEAFPITLLEAMAAGAVPVVTDTGDNASVVGDAGVVVPVRNAGALSRGWTQVLALPAAERERMSRVARERVVAAYTVDRLDSSCLATYREFMAEIG